MISRLIFRLAAIGLLGLSAPATAAAQGLFAPVVTIDGAPVTAYELDQRMRMLQVFRSAGDLRAEATTALIDERLQVREARRLNLTATPAEIEEGETEFAARADLDRDAFLQALAAGGVEPETFRDFVTAGLLWRKVVSERFAGRVGVSEREIDAVLADDGRRPGLRILLSEIILPADTAERAARSRALAGELAQITGQSAFEAAAREYSAAPSRERGGRIDWMPLDNLPPALRALVRPLAPGRVAGPIQVPNALVLFQLRGIEEVADLGPDTRTLDYAAFYIPGGRSAAALAEAARIDAVTDTCDDLYGLARGLPANRLQRDRLPPSEVPADVAMELAKLDPGEASTALTRAGGQTLVYLMLCDRIPAEPEGGVPSRDRIRDRLVNRRAAAYADNYLSELRANATIVEVR